MSRRGPMVVGAVFAAVALIALVFVVLPKMSAVSKARADLTAAETHQQELEAQLEQLQQAQQEAPQVQQQLHDLAEKIPPTEDSPGLIRLVADAAASSAVDVATLSPGAPTVDASAKFSVIPVSITVAGTFFSLDEFIFRLEHLPRAMKVMSVQVTQGAPPFELSVALNVEVYTTDTSSGAVT